MDDACQGRGCQASSSFTAGGPCCAPEWFVTAEHKTINTEAVVRLRDSLHDQIGKTDLGENVLGTGLLSMMTKGEFIVDEPRIPSTEACGWVTALVCPKVPTKIQDMEEDVRKIEESTAAGTKPSGFTGFSGFGLRAVDCVRINF